MDLRRTWRRKPLIPSRVAVLAVTALGLYLTWNLTRTVITPPVFLVGAGLIGTLVAVAVLVRRDGLSADQLAWAAIGHRSRPRHLVPAPEGADRIPAAPRWVTHRAARGQPRPPAPTGLSAEALRLPQAVTAAGDRPGQDLAVGDIGGAAAADSRACCSARRSTRSCSTHRALSWSSTHSLVARYLAVRHPAIRITYCSPSSERLDDVVERASRRRKAVAASWPADPGPKDPCRFPHTAIA